LTIPLDHTSLLGSLDIAFHSNFMYPSGYIYGGKDTSGSHTPASGDAVSGLQWLIQGGTHSSVPFSLARGDQLDLSQILHGAPAAQDLTNIGQFVKVLGHGPNDPSFGHGTQTVIQISGPSDQAIVHLQGSGKLDLEDLVKHDSLIPPSS
jgi:hypothetical protein